MPKNNKSKGKNSNLLQKKKKSQLIDLLNNPYATQQSNSTPVTQLNVESELKQKSYIESNVYSISNFYESNDNNELVNDSNCKSTVLQFLIPDLFSIVSSYLKFIAKKTVSIKSCGHTCELRKSNTKCCYCADQRNIQDNDTVERSKYIDGQGLVSSKRNLYYCPLCAGKITREDTGSSDFELEIVPVEVSREPKFIYGYGYY